MSCNNRAVKHPNCFRQFFLRIALSHLVLIGSLLNMINNAKIVSGLRNVIAYAHDSALRAIRATLRNIFFKPTTFVDFAFIR